MPLANVNGININYEIAGRGEPLILIGGYNADISIWKRQTSALKPYFKLIVFDNRGAGKSDKPQGSYSILDMAEDTLKLMDYLNIQHTSILGVSMGGMIAQELAIRYPERVSKLILASSHAGTDNKLNGGTADIVKAWDQPVRTCTKRVLGACCNKAFNRLVLAPILQFKVGRLREAEVAGLLGQMEACRNHNTFDRLSQIKAPTLVITGTRDRVVKPTSSDLLAQKIPGARLVRFEGGSHLVNWEMSKRFNEEIYRFLTLKD